MTVAELAARFGGRCLTFDKGNARQRQQEFPKADTLARKLEKNFPSSEKKIFEGIQWLDTFSVVAYSNTEAIIIFYLF